MITLFQNVSDNKSTALQKVIQKERSVLIL